MICFYLTRIWDLVFVWYYSNRSNRNNELRTLQSTVEHAKQLQKEVISVGKKLDPNLNQVSEGLSVQQVTLEKWKKLKY